MTDAANGDGGSFAGEDGVEISYREWRPVGDPRAAVVISHGAGEHSGRYQHVAEALTAAGYVVFGIDHRGHGRSPGERMRFSAVAPLAADVGRMVAVAAEEAPAKNPFLLAHSMGALIALDWALDHQEQLSGIVFSGALASVDQARAARMAARAIARVAPGRGVFKVDPQTISRDPEVMAAYEADPLNFNGSYPAETIVALERTGLSFPDRLPELAIPILLMHGGDDTLTNPAGSRLVNELASSEDKTLRIYDGLRHEILNEPEGPEIIAEIVAWLDAH